MKLNFKLFWVLAIFLFTLSCNKEVSNKVKKKPNILLIFTDDQRSDALGIAQNTEIKTPNIDNLARSGVYFKNCLLYTSPSPRDGLLSRMPSSA